MMSTRTISRSCALGLLLATVGCSFQGPPIELPGENDWIECGVVLETGAPGDWDSRFSGASSPSGLLLHDGTYYLYYGGADGLRSTDQGPRHRAIGVATSPDGVRFTKYAQNPVMTHLPTEWEEEGANSAAMALDDDGRFVMFYGAATMLDRDQINADGRWADSADGFEFTDRGRVLDHTDESLFGYGDELFPLAAYRHEGNWYVFYVVNGGTAYRDVGVAWGPTPDRLTRSALAIDGERTHPARMGGNVIRAGEDWIVLFAQRGWKPEVTLEILAARADRPDRLSPPLAIYDGPLWKEQTKFFTVYLDRSRHTWLLYRLNWEQRFVLHTAPFGAVDTTGPSPPQELAIEISEAGKVSLRWQAALEPESGVGPYVIYRDGVEIGRTIETHWTDETGAAGSAPYAVSAVNFHGVEGERAEAGS